MSFRDPGYLWLALLLIVPLVLYLLPMPRRRALTSALYLWERFLKMQPYGQVSERFRRAVGLALMLAILGLMILAAADLTVGRAVVRAPRLIVLLEASASMNAVRGARERPQTGLALAKTAAAQLTRSLESGCRVTVVEAARDLRTLAEWESAGGAAEAVSRIGPCDGAADLGAALDEAFRLWGGDPQVQLFAFTDRDLPKTAWGDRARAWIAPTAGDNVAVVSLDVRRRGRTIVAGFALANYGRSARTVRGHVSTRSGAQPAPEVRATIEDVTLAPGQLVRREARFEEGDGVVVEAGIDGAADALAADDTAFAEVPAVEAQAVRVVWPDEKKQNDYVAAVLGALQDQGIMTLAKEGEGAGRAAPPAVTVYVYHAPDSWRAAGSRPADRGAILLYPLQGESIRIAGLCAEPVRVDRQAEHPLLEDVDLRGLEVKDAVQAAVPEWAQPLVWAQSSQGELPLIWAGETNGTRVVFSGIPLLPAASRLPLAASFPVLMRNAVEWMLPAATIRRPGDRIGTWTSRRAGLAMGPGNHAYAFSVLSAPESDLRRPDAARAEPFPHRRPLAGILAVLAVGLLAVEWGLFHKRLTE